MLVVAVVLEDLANLVLLHPDHVVVHRIVDAGVSKHLAVAVTVKRLAGLGGGEHVEQTQRKQFPHLLF